MKHIKKIISLFLITAMLALCFAGCDDSNVNNESNENNDSNESNETSDSSEASENIPAELQKIIDEKFSDVFNPNSSQLDAVSFEFESLGGGNCRIIDFSVNIQSDETKTIKFPSTSPSGEKVTNIALRGRYGNLPMFLLPEDYEKLTSEENLSKLTNSEKIMFKLLFSLRDLDQEMSRYEGTLVDANIMESKKEKLLSYRPYLEIISVYEFNAMYANDFSILSKYLDKLGYTQQDCINDFKKLVTKVASDEKCTPDILLSLKKPILSHKGNAEVLEIPEGVTEVNLQLFDDAEFKSVSIPSTIISVEGLEKCDNLLDINYNGTKEQFSAISGNSKHPNTTIHCTDGDIPPTENNK